MGLASICGLDGFAFGLYATYCRRSADGRLNAFGDIVTQTTFNRFKRGYLTSLIQFCSFGLWVARSRVEITYLDSEIDRRIF